MIWKREAGAGPGSRGEEKEEAAFQKVGGMVKDGEQCGSSESSKGGKRW